MKECDGVYHLAAAVGVDLILERPRPHDRDEHAGDRSRAPSREPAQQKRVLITSTSEVYGKSEKGPVPRGRRRRSSARRTGTLGLRGSKMVDEFLALAYWIEKRLRS